MTGAIELSVVVPILNEQDILLENLTHVALACDQIIGKGRWKFILVDNGSTDHTPAIIDQIIEAWPPSVCVHEPIPNYGNALRAGLKAADTAWAKIIDVEQWDIPFLAWGWAHKDGYDLLIGSKRADPTLYHQTRYRTFLSWGLNSLLQLFFQYPGSETHGPKFLRMEAMIPILDSCRLSRGQFDSEFTLRALRKGLWLAEAPVVYEEQRPPKNLMVKKIVLNLREFNRLRRLLANDSYQGSVRLRRFCREDVLEAVAPFNFKQDVSS